MRIAGIVLDSPPQNWSGEFHEISVPFGLAPCRVDRKTGTHSQPVERYAMYTGSTFHPPSLCPLRVLLKYDQIEDDSSIYRWQTRHVLFCCVGGS